jgi:SnoaL-like domain
MGRVTPLKTIASNPVGIASDDRAVRERIRDWYRCWPKGVTEGTAVPLTAAKEIHLLSDFGSDVAVSRSMADYRELWQPILKDTFSRWHMSIVSAINLRRTREMAAANFFTQLSGITHEGSMMNQVQAVSQVWERTTARWHLVQEHSTVHNAPL